MEEKVDEKSATEFSLHAGRVGLEKKRRAPACHTVFNASVLSNGPRCFQIRASVFYIFNLYLVYLLTHIAREMYLYTFNLHILILSSHTTTHPGPAIGAAPRSRVLVAIFVHGRPRHGASPLNPMLPAGEENGVGIREE